MTADICVLAGPARSGKTAALLVRYRQTLVEQSHSEFGFGTGLWLSPTKHSAREIRERLLQAELRGCFAPAVYTFEQFVHTVLACSETPPRFLGNLLKRHLIRRVISDALNEKRLEYFAPIAETAGLIDLVDGFISDLKRQEISPKKFAMATALLDGKQKNQELAEIYADYQTLLHKHRLFDLEERFTAAREFLTQAPPANWGPFANLKCVVIDGFTDFTGTQLEIIRLLATKSPSLSELTISLPVESAAGRGDLFHKSNTSLKQLRSRLPGLNVVWQPRSAEPDWPGLAHLEQHLFENPRFETVASDTAGIEVVSTAGQRAEIEWMARRIKSLLVFGDAIKPAEPCAAGLKESANGKHSNPEELGEVSSPVPAEDIAVVLRNVEPLAALVEEVFNEYGIPISIDSPRRLNRSPMLQALVGFLRLEADGWPFRQVLAALSNNYLQPAWPEWQSGEAIAAADWAVRQLQIPNHCKTLLSALQRHADAEDVTLSIAVDGEAVDESDAKHQLQRRERFRIAAALLNQLATKLNDLNRPREFADWVDALNRIVEALGLLNSASASNQPLQTQENAATDDRSLTQASSTEADRAAWRQLKNALAAAKQLEEQWLELEPAVLSLPEFIARLQEIMSIEPLPIDHDQVGRVRVLSAPGARALSIPYLFVAALTEKSFPPPGRDDRIYTEAEYRRLNEAGLQFMTQSDRSCDEMLLFYEVINRANKRLVLSYPALDEKAQPLLESPYLSELRRCCGADRLQETNAISLSPVPQHNHAFSPIERRVLAISDLAAGKSDRLATMLAEAKSSRVQFNLAAGLQTILSRGSFQSFGQFEGLLSDNAAKHALAHHFRPQHCWSVSRLEEYAYCPYRFFAGHVLGLEELPELSLAVDYGRRGFRAHEALAELHRRLNSAGAPQSPAMLGADDFVKLKDDTLAILFQNIPKGSELDTALQTIDFELIDQWLTQYLGQHQKYDECSGALEEPLMPAHFEVSFGLKRRSGEQVDPLSTEKPFILQCGEETIRLSGRIDRIDIGLHGGQVVFNVLDYKTGSKRRVRPQDLQMGLALQLPLYALAVQELLMVDRRAVPWRVGYWFLKEKGFDAGGLPNLFDVVAGTLQETNDWNALRGTLLARVAELVRGIRGGQFPVFSQDSECTSLCSYRTICRIGQVRAQGKVWPAREGSVAHLSPDQSSSKSP